MAPRFIPFGFVIVGVQKAGTTTLHNLLIEHPAVVSTRKKERHFFDDDKRDWERPDYTDYRVWPKAEGEHVSGEATPSYLFWPEALPRMRAYRADMPLVACFRDPVERAFSHWNMDYVRRGDLPQFAELVRAGLSSETPAPEQWTKPTMRRRSMVARGLYGVQLARGLEVFDREQWLLLEFRAAMRDLPGTGSAIVDFLGLEPFRPAEPERQSNVSSSSVEADPVTTTDVELLVAEYAEDLPLFTRLSGLDTSAWPTSRVLAGDLSAADLADRLNAKAGLTRS